MSEWGIFIRLDSFLSLSLVQSELRQPRTFHTVLRVRVFVPQLKSRLTSKDPLAPYPSHLPQHVLVIQGTLVILVFDACSNSINTTPTTTGLYGSDPIYIASHHRWTIRVSTLDVWIKLRFNLFVRLDLSPATSYVLQTTNTIYNLALRDPTRLASILSPCVVSYETPLPKSQSPRHTPSTYKNTTIIQLQPLCSSTISFNRSLNDTHNQDATIIHPSNPRYPPLNSTNEYRSTSFTSSLERIRDLETDSMGCLEAARGICGFMEERRVEEFE